MSEVISSFGSMRAGSQVISLMLFLCVILHAAAMHLTLWYIMFVCHQNEVCENSIGIVYVGGYCGQRESGLCVFGKLCLVGFLVVCKCSTVLLQSISYRCVI